MKKLRLAILVSGASVGITGFLFACSADDTIITPAEAGTPESGTDAAVDQNTAADTSTNDVKTDGPQDIDAGLTLDNYETKLAAVLCQTLARCCFGNANLDGGGAVDGGTYDQASCLAFYKGVGFESNSGEIPANKANLVLDNAKGNECVTKLTNLTCDTPGTEYTSVAQSCFAAIVGKQTAGQPCTKSVECTPGNFCNTGDGGTSVCAALRPLDGPCGDWFPSEDPPNNAERSGEACSYRGKSVDTFRYCDAFDFNAGDFRAQVDWKCKTTLDAGSLCPNSSWCKDSLCDDNSNTCVTPKKFFSPTAPGSPAGCGKFAKP